MEVIKLKYGERTKHPLYNRWRDMKQRCYNPNHNDYKNYGGRGISVCYSWYFSFDYYVHWCLTNGWKKGLEIDRENNDKEYSPLNCRMVSRRLNALNTRKRVDSQYYTGVYQDVTKLNKGFKSFYFQICNKGKRFCHGMFGTDIEALKARNGYIVEHKLKHKLQEVPAWT